MSFESLARRIQENHKNRPQFLAPIKTNYVNPDKANGLNDNSLSSIVEAMHGLWKGTLQTAGDIQDEDNIEGSSFSLALSNSSKSGGQETTEPMKSVVVLNSNDDFTDYLNSKCGSDGKTDQTSSSVCAGTNIVEEDKVIGHVNHVMKKIIGSAISIVSEKTPDLSDQSCCNNDDGTDTNSNNSDVDPFNHLLKENENLASENKDKAAHIEVLKGHLERCESEQVKISEEVTTLRKRNSTLEEEIGILKGKIFQLNEQLNGTVDELKRTKMDMVENYKLAYEETRLLAGKAQQKIARLTKMLQQSTSDNSELKQKLNREKVLHDKIVPKITIKNKELRRNLDSEVRKHLDLQERLSLVNERLRLKERDNDNLKIKVERLEKDLKKSHSTGTTSMQTVSRSGTVHEQTSVGSKENIHRNNVCTNQRSRTLNPRCLIRQQWKQ